jgi:hypothetical protein
MTVEPKEGWIGKMKYLIILAFLFIGCHQEECMSVEIYEHEVFYGEHAGEFKIIPR